MHRDPLDHDTADLPGSVPGLVRVGLALAALAVLLVLLAGPGTRFGVWGFRTAFTLLQWGAYLGIAALLLCLAGAVFARPGSGRGGSGSALLGAVLAAVAFAAPLAWRRSASGAPPIHDITTDPANPPSFVAVLPLRRDALNPPNYEGDSIAALQRKAYPDIQPLMLALRPDSAFAVALAAARRMGWEIVAAQRGEGRIEATDVTPWFGFKDDVVIRIQPASGISRVDVRSVSRVGTGDTGTNAKRIRAYLAKLRPYAAVAG